MNDMNNCSNCFAFLDFASNPNNAVEADAYKSRPRLEESHLWGKDFSALFAGEPSVLAESDLELFHE